MCRPGPDFNCEHLPKRYDKNAETFQIRTGKGEVWNTMSIRLCPPCAESLIDSMELTEKDKNIYGCYTPETQSSYI